MKRILTLLKLFLGIILLISCKDKMICPAFQSTYLLEEQASKQRFSLFGEDSLPKGKVFIKKNQYGMIVKVRYRKRVDDMQTISMRTVYPPDQIDSLANNYESFVALDEDTMELDASEKFNVRYNNDQRNYMKYIGDDIARAYERKLAEYNKAKKEKEDEKAANPKRDKKAIKEEKQRLRKERKEPPKVEEEEDEWDRY